MLYCKLIILQIVKQKAPFLLPAEFFYGTLDEITGNIRTFVLPNENETYTFVMDLEHLSSYTSATPQGYTKHYYAGTERVVSKIGCGGLKEITSPIEELEGAFTPIPEKRDMLYGQLDRTVHECLGRESEIIWDNLKYLRELEGLQCEEEQELYFYHPDHLGSTGMVTDNNANITQGFLYAPFGEIITEFNPSWESGRIPKYSFNGKELDEESGMYYYSARYYSPPTFISRDPLFEKKFTSPYAYCLNNPLRFIDPDGRDEWEINKQGEVRWIKESDKHTLFALNENGDRTGASLTLKDRTIFDGLAESGANSDYSLSTATGGENSQDAMLQTFKFAADNTNVEWRVDRFRAEGGGSNYSIGTIHNTGFAPTAEAMGHSKSSVIAFIHSHPNTSLADERYSMGSYYPRTDIPKLGGSVDGDCRVKRSDYPNTPYYMYSPNSGNVWAVSTKGASSHQFIRKVRNHKGFMFGTLNTR